MTVGLVQAGRPTRIAKHEGADAREIYICFGAEGAQTLENMYFLAPKAPKRSEICMFWRRRRPNARKYVWFGAEDAEALRNMYVLAPRAPKRSKICMVWRRRRRNAQKCVWFGAPRRCGGAALALPRRRSRGVAEALPRPRVSLVLG